MSFLFPGFLWLLPLVVLVWFWPRRGLRLSHGLLRSTVFMALLLGLARPVVIRAAWTDHQVVIFDRTASVVDPAAADAALQRVVAAMPAGGVRVLVEVGSPASDDRPRGRGFQRRILVDGADASPLGTAIALAVRAIPEGAAGAVTLISDGLATDERWGEAIQELTERGLPLHTVALALAPGDARPVGLAVPTDLRVGHLARIQIAVAADDARCRVVLTADGAVVARSNELHCQGTAVVTLEVEPPQAGFVELLAELEVLAGEDRDPGNNRLRRVVAVQDPLRVLYLGDRIEAASQHLAQLLGAGFAIREAPPREANLELGTTDLVVLDDRPAALVPQQWQDAIAAAVKARGMGLLVSGGRSAFGPGGFHQTVIEEISPVEYVQKEEKKDPSIALAIVIDTSGSMVGNRMTLAKEIARLAIRRLQPHDKVGIVEFYGTKTWAAPIQSAANAIDLQRALNRLGAMGGTVLFPAVEESFYALKNVQTRHKHVLILTDAGVESGPYEALLRKMNDEGIAVSTVLVGPGRHSEFLVELADWGGGRYYNAPDRFNLPELLLKKPSTSMLPSDRPGVFEVEARGGPGWWGAVDTEVIPPLQSLVETAPRPGADVLLAVVGSGRPVLATWKYGLGRVTSLCTEPVGPGTAAWRQWQGYGPFLGRVLARTARSAQEPFEITTWRDDTRLHLEARRMVRDTLMPDVAIQDGDAVAMRELAPGVFRGAVVAAPSDVIKLDISSAGGFFHRHASDPLEVRAGETQVDPRRALPLDRAAVVTGGRYVAVGAAVPPLAVARTGAPLETWALWPWFVLLALLAFIADVFQRRRGGAAQRIDA